MSYITQLALAGGPPAVTATPPPWPLPEETVREALLAAHASGDWGRYHGPHCEQLAAELAAYVGVGHCRLCCSGTFAVELALRMLQVRSGDRVVLAGYDFPGNFRAIEAVGAMPLLVDIGHDWAIDHEALAAALTLQPRAMIVSHLHGGLAPMERLMAQAHAAHVAVVEDACQAAGATIAGRAAGAWGDVGVWSFGGSKLLTAGRGGAVLTDDATLHQRATIYCERGNDAYPLSELQAAVLLPQLASLEQRHRQRAKAAIMLMERWRSLPGVTVPAASRQPGSPAYYKLGVQLGPELLDGVERRRWIAALAAEGLPIDAGFRGFVKRPASRVCKLGELEQSRRAAEGTLVLHHPVLLSEPSVVQQVAAGLEKVHAAFADRT